MTPDFTIADKLAEARKLIEAGWTQGADARDAAGDDADPLDEAAVCFCANGALYRAGATGREYNLADAALERAVGAARFDLVAWNDAPERTQAEVIEAFKRAEQIAREQVSS